MFLVQSFSFNEPKIQIFERNTHQLATEFFNQILELSTSVSTTSTKYLLLPMISSPFTKVEALDLTKMSDLPFTSEVSNYPHFVELKSKVIFL